MKLYNYISKNILFLLAPVSLLLLASCGSYQYSGYQPDGVYGENTRNYDEQAQNVSPTDNGDYYKSLFEEESALYGDVLADGSIFTDVENYSTTGDYNLNEKNTNYQGGNAPWGEDPDEYTVNIYSDNYGYGFGYGYPYYGYGYGFGYGYPYYGYGYGYNPYYNPYYGYPYYGYPYYGYGYGYGSYGIGFAINVHPFFYGTGGYYNPYYYYGNTRGFNYSNHVAYNHSRRNSYYGDTHRTDYIRATANLDSRGRSSSSYSRSIRNMRSSGNNDYGTSRRTYSGNYNTRSNTNTYRTNRSSRSYDPGTYRSSRSNSNNGTYRSSAPVRRSAPTTTRSSGSTTRSSGSTTRSSGGSTRGSGRGRG